MVGVIWTSLGTAMDNILDNGPFPGLLQSDRISGQNSLIHHLHLMLHKCLLNRGIHKWSKVNEAVHIQVVWRHRESRIHFPQVWYPESKDRFLGFTHMKKEKTKEDSCHYIHSIELKTESEDSPQLKREKEEINQPETTYTGTWIGGEGRPRFSPNLSIIT